MFRRAGRAVALFLICALAVPTAVTGTVLATFLFAPLPATLPEPKNSEASVVSHVLDANGDEIGVFLRFEQSIPVAEADIPDHLKQAVIAAEDRNFYSHSGVDVRGSLRALWADFRNQSIVQGGSTITQQYVKNAYVGRERSVVRKVREAILASQLDRQKSKTEILFLYLSNVYLGEGAYGVGAASEAYFRKPVSALTLSESALLAGLIPAPSRYEPRGNPTLAEGKRKLVLQQMLRQGRITQQQYDEALPQQVWLATRGRPPGPATIVHPPREVNTKFPYFVDYVRRYLEKRYGEDYVYTAGLTIQTTLDPQLQVEAEEAVAKSLAGSKPPIDMALASVEPTTGYVKALVGGRQFDQSEVNIALGGCPKKRDVPVEVQASCWETPTVEGGGLGKQPGSAFKPFVLAAAYEKGYAPSKVYPAPSAFRIPNCKPRPPKEDCLIHNAEGGGGGSSTMKNAMVHSINTVYAQIVRDVGCKETGEMAKKLGITSAWYSPRFHSCDGSYALGVIDVSPLDMASAYGVFANRGLRAQPTPVLIVRDRDGKVLEDNTKPKAERVIDEAVADNVTDALRGVIGSGTGTRANIGRPAAGKTGTGQNYTNAWFVGYAPTLSTAVWMGDRTSQSTRLLNIRGPYGVVSRVFGGTIPADTWKRFMSAALREVPVTEFSEPAPIKPLADAVKRRARQGFDPGSRRSLVDTGDGGPYEVVPPDPTVDPPVTTPPEPEEDDDDGPPGGGGGPRPPPSSTTTSSSTTSSTALLP
ncbi:MAG TPA: transglycosylase domain-containing protein [Acidimicrobiales bacterium]|nr:transglycosylase domain-containing protein [Acidimicrobiales bacterium]